MMRFICIMPAMSPLVLLGISSFTHATREVRFTFADGSLHETGVSGCVAMQDDVT